MREFIWNKDFGNERREGKRKGRTYIKVEGSSNKG